MLCMVVKIYYTLYNIQKSPTIRSFACSVILCPTSPISAWKLWQVLKLANRSIKWVNYLSYTSCSKKTVPPTHGGNLVKFNRFSSHFTVGKTPLVKKHVIFLTCRDSAELCLICAWKHYASYTENLIEFQHWKNVENRLRFDEVAGQNFKHKVNVIFHFEFCQTVQIYIYFNGNCFIITDSNTVTSLTIYVLW